LRKLLIGALAGVVVLAVAAVAMATTTTTFDQKYIDAKGKVSKKTGASVGTSFSTTSTEDANPDKNNQPKSTRQFNITFPAGTKVDQKAAPQCKNLDESANDPCPKNTKIGSGHAKVRLPYPGFADIDALVTAYNRKGGLFLYVVPQFPNQAPVVLKPKFDGLTLKTSTPPNCVASTNQNGRCVDSSGNPGTEAVLVEFDLKTKATKKGKHTFLKSPTKCKGGSWTFKANITYDDGSSVSKSSKTPCKK
jgi:hypothetical protein